MIEVVLNSYDVMGIYDLAEITTSPYRIYQILYKHYQSVFSEKQRIVFYSHFEPGIDLLSHIHQAAKLIDIDNYFILLCLPCDISSILNEVCKDSNKFDVLVGEFRSNSLGDSFKLPPTICPIPWIGMEVKPNGDISPCCVSAQVIGNAQDGLQSAFTSESMSQLRADLLSGKKPIGCQHCWAIEKENLISNRIRHNNYLLKKLLIQGLDQPRLEQLDLKFNNTCNFKCRICSSYNSSAFATEHAKANNIPIITITDQGKNQKFLDELIEALPNLTNIDMYGGEPFLIKSFTKLIKIAVELDYAKNIRLHYNSNGSVYPNDLIPHWPRFKGIDIQFSIDAIGPRFEIERGGTWKEVENNILKIKNLNLPNIKISVMPAIGIMNVFYIDEVIEWATQHNFNINPQYVSSPSELSLTQLTKEAKLMLLEKFKDYSWPEMHQILSYIQRLPDSDAVGFIEKTQYFDSIRNENFAETHPEIARALGYVYNKS
jgi:MoaA/NifB/PqqE/SkfB family radical SAM enzyme